MERLTRRSKVGEGLPTKHMNLMHMDTTSEDTLTKLLDRLADYEDTGLTPEEIKSYIEAFKRLSHISVDKDRKIDKLTVERDYWEREAKKWCDKLFEIRRFTEGGASDGC